MDTVMNSTDREDKKPPKNKQDKSCIKMFMNNIL